MGAEQAWDQIRSKPQAVYLHLVHAAAAAAVVLITVATQECWVARGAGLGVLKALTAVKSLFVCLLWSRVVRSG